LFASAFVIPKVYSTKGEKINEVISKLETQTSKILIKMLAKVPKYSDLKQD